MPHVKGRANPRNWSSAAGLHPGYHIPHGETPGTQTSWGPGAFQQGAWLTPPLNCSPKSGSPVNPVTPEIRRAPALHDSQPEGKPNNPSAC